MNNFTDSNFLLRGETAQSLYHNHASKMPIIDYHCHLSPQLIAQDYKFRTITELWLGGDHYKWRAMRACGVAEEYITGDKSDWEKFQKWAETMPYCLRNPLYHWSHMELRTAFGIDTILDPSTAREIYDRCNELLALPEYSARGLMRRYLVEAVCTTDDPIDSLEYHKQIADSDFEINVYPTWRPDKLLAVEDVAQFGEYINKLSEVSGVVISDYATLFKALKLRQDYFEKMGCRVADHGISEFYAADYTTDEVDTIFKKILDGKSLTQVEIEKYRSATLLELAKMNHAKGWAQQLHFGPLRNTRTRVMRSYGVDAGCDSMNDTPTATSMAIFLDRLDSSNQLAKSVIYNLNPSANEMVASMVGNFQDGSYPGKIQFGTAWWFLDQLDGMRRQIDTLSTQGLLSLFVGMLTDSRSFVSYPRHEYFRRLLCDIIGEDIDRGLIPASQMERVAQMVEDICYNNAKRYFKL